MADKTILEKLENGNYRNTKEVIVGGIPFTIRDVLVKAPLIAGLNVYLIGGTGEGKSQLCYDLNDYFGESYCFMEGRNDFEPSELFKHIRLDKLNKPEEIKTDAELIELTENARKCLYYVEELNRCKEIVQNYFFSLFDGKIPFMGRIVPLGRRNYSLGYASGNLGNGNYIGTSDSDRALKDRMHLIVNLDYPDFRPTPRDKYNVFSSKKDPRARLPAGGEDCLEEIITLHEKFKERNVPAIIPLIGVFLNEGLDYLENVKGNSKRAKASKWPRIQGIRTDTDESKIFPLSTRSVFSAIALSQALEMIAEHKGREINDSVPLFLDCLRFIVPYSGVLAEDYVFNEYDGDAYTAFDSILGRGAITGFNARNREQINTKLPLLEEGLYLVQQGIVDTKLLDRIANSTNPVEGKWHPVRNVLRDIGKEYVENPEIAQERLRLENILEEIKKPGKN